ncbi:hypothetical protein AB4508_13545 [Vibrio splendidus]
MSANGNSILLIGESGVGKTHYGAQLLKRLMKGDGQLRMNGAATNLEPFEATMNCLDEGLAAEHTASNVYVDSIWPIADLDGASADLVWPDYAGEQILAISKTRRIPEAWRSRVSEAPSWLFLVRLQQTRVTDDIFSKPLSTLQGTVTENQDIQISDQARLIELLQILLYIRKSASTKPALNPRLCVLLSCWDELGEDKLPEELLRSRMPMLSSFISSTWSEPSVLGLSALEQSLDPKEYDEDYSIRGPEQFGYIVLPDGQRTPDLTLPIQHLIAGRI